MIYDANIEPEIARGLEIVSTMTNRAVVGVNADVDAATAPEDIWQVGGIYTGFPSSAEPLVITGDDAADDSDGTGARAVAVSGIDENWALVNEVITTAGIGASAASTTSFLRVTSATVVSAGSGGANAGTLIVHHETTTANVFRRIEPGDNISDSASYSTPVNREATIKNVVISVRNTGGGPTAKAAAAVAVRWNNGLGTPMLRAFKFWVGNEVQAIQNYNGAIRIPPQSDLIWQAVDATADNLEVTVGGLVIERDIGA